MKPEAGTKVIVQIPARTIKAYDPLLNRSRAFPVDAFFGAATLMKRDRFKNPDAIMSNSVDAHETEPRPTWSAGTAMAKLNDGFSTIVIVWEDEIVGRV